MQIELPRSVAQSNRPAPAPPMAGASHPPGQALAFRGYSWQAVLGGRGTAGGETRVAFLIPPSLMWIQTSNLARIGK
ncbi:MAG: hypothetical protein DI533_06575 [Cereibacter sphaeroides]|uniref:Uncharacterized protein n=1 Tax=Cereibacter sphaeroides TaxID=1063 RepID=A0A2W5SEH7_CERSP|nr:MAG: hypothetical protein DI533_06575 [Cereibacter sphaeroides]